MENAMKLLSALALIFLSIGAKKSFGNDELSGSYKLTCKYEYSSIYHLETQKRSVSMFAKEDENGVANFSTEKKFLPAYYFNDSQSPPEPVWHNDAGMVFSAVLDGATLTYNFKFSNYLFSRSAFQVLFDETREIDVSSIFYRSQARFKFSSGRLLDQDINLQKWVNKDSVTMVECVLDAF